MTLLRIAEYKARFMGKKRDRDRTGAVKALFATGHFCKITKICHTYHLQHYCENTKDIDCNHPSLLHLATCSHPHHTLLWHQGILGRIIWHSWLCLCLGMQNPLHPGGTFGPVDDGQKTFFVIKFLFIFLLEGNTYRYVQARETEYIHM